MAEAGRVPDLVIVGAMKSASTSLHRWLHEQPEVFMASPKETNYFTTSWSRGAEWYSHQFDEAAPEQLAGESSVNYTDPALSPKAAERMAQVIPNARLIYVLRHPVDRIRSHYRHEVQRRRESRPLLEALGEPGNSYVAHSSYHTAFAPYIERFPREQLLVVRFEDLVKPPSPAWSRVLEFLALDDRPVPEEAHNVSAEKAQWTWAMSFAKRKRLITFGQISKLPAPVRRVGKKIFARGGAGYEKKLDESRVAIPPGLLATMWDDVARLEAWLASPLWSPDETAVRGAAS
jgi:hypothetical protein